MELEWVGWYKFVPFMDATGTDVPINNKDGSSPGSRLSGCVAENNIIHASGGSRLSGCDAENGNQVHGNGHQIAGYGWG